MIIKPILDSYAAASERVFKTDRSQTVGASDVGQCARKTFWTKNEGDPQLAAARDPGYVDRWGAKVRGTIIENNFWEPAMRHRYHDQLLFAGVDQKTFVSSFLSATPDGLIVGLTPGEIAPGSGTEVMAECKSADPRTNLSEAKEHNVYQTQIQMGLIREQTEYRPTHSVLSYIDASFWDEVTEFVIPFDQAIYNNGKARATRIMTATSFEELKPEGWIGGGKECAYCPFTIACGIERRDMKAEAKIAADPQFVAEITDLCREIQTLDNGIDRDSVAMRDLQTDLRMRLKEKGIRRIAGVVSWSPVKGRKSYDNKKIQEALESTGVDLEQFAKTGEATDRLVITL
jgi:hypothetical protein